MRQSLVLNRDGFLNGTNERDLIDTYDINDFPYNKLNTHTIRSKKQKIKSYYEEFATFDIETTSYIINDKHKFGFMYHWQMCVGGIVITGRTWKEWLDFLKRLQKVYKFDNENKFVIYVHNLAFEYQFMYKFLQTLGDISVFATKPRKPIKVSVSNGLEFRCSYFLTNMSLYGFTKNEDVEHPKAKNDLDYKKIRTAKTILDDIEFGYCVSDVLGLYEAIKHLMKHYNDTIDSIPLTSTSYIRRDARNTTKKDNKYRQNVFLKLQFDKEVYTLLKEAGRGGNTHANRFKSNNIIDNVYSFDAVSEYPAQLLLRKFPMSKFECYGDIEDLEEFYELLESKACLFRIVFENLKVKKDIAIPYISVSKTETDGHKIEDNGRLLKCDGLTNMTITDIDFKIIEEQYTWDGIAISDMYIANYDYLPKIITDFVFSLFAEKCEIKEKIKDIIKAHPDDYMQLEEYRFTVYLYNKCKNKLNGVFGMMYTDPCRDTIEFSPDLDNTDIKEEWSLLPGNIEESLEKFFKSRNSFLNYAWGVWTTAWGRYHLNSLTSITKDNTLYCDTDSDKCINPDFNAIIKLNDSIAKLVEDRNYVYTSSHGNKYYIGLFENETDKEPYHKFITLGAKKYAYEDSQGLHVTISGVNKEWGGKELGSIENFKIGFIFNQAGGSQLTYTCDNIHDITIDGCTMQTAASICIEDSTYTLGVSKDYAEILGIEYIN